MNPRAHDASYKQLFNSPLMVMHLLEGFVRQAGLGPLSTDAIEPAPTSLIAPGLKLRHSDQIWRVRLADGQEVYVILEFQSRRDAIMALRTCIYSALFYEALLQGNRIKPGGLWPPVLCIVLYNGRRPWHGSTHLHDRIWRPRTGLLRQGMLRHSFVLVDMQHQVLQNRRHKNNLVALLMKFERDLPPSGFVSLIGKLDQLLPQAGEIRHQFTQWIEEKVGQGSEWAQMTHTLLLERGQEMNWAQRVQKWEKEHWLKGVQVGRLEGRQEGRQEGRLESLQSTLTRLFQKRFDHLDEPTQKRIQQASVSQLEDWLVRVIDAKSVSEVFDPVH